MAPTEELEGAEQAMDALLQDVSRSVPAAAVGGETNASTDSPEAWHDCAEELKDRQGQSNVQGVFETGGNSEKDFHIERQEEQQDQEFPGLAEITGFGENAEPFADEGQFQDLLEHHLLRFLTE